MNDFLVLISRIFFIALLQIIVEMFIDPKARPYHAFVLNTACFMGCLYLLLDFVYNNILNNLNTAFKLPVF